MVDLHGQEIIRNSRVHKAKPNYGLAVSLSHAVYVDHYQSSFAAYMMMNMRSIYMYSL